MAPLPPLATPVKRAFLFCHNYCVSMSSCDMACKLALIAQRLGLSRACVSRSSFGWPGSFTAEMLLMPPNELALRLLY